MCVSRPELLCCLLKPAGLPRVCAAKRRGERRAMNAPRKMAAGEVRRIKRRSLLSRLLLTHAKSESSASAGRPAAASSVRRQLFSRSSVRFPRYSVRPPPCISPDFFAQFPGRGVCLPFCSPALFEDARPRRKIVCAHRVCVCVCVRGELGSAAARPEIASFSPRNSFGGIPVAALTSAAAAASSDCAPP